MGLSGFRTMRVVHKKIKKAQPNIEKENRGWIDIYSQK